MTDFLWPISAAGIKGGHEFHQLPKVRCDLLSRAFRVDAIKSNHRPGLAHGHVKRIEFAATISAEYEAARVQAFE